MGYTHYWYRDGCRTIEPATFRKIVEDFQLVAARMEVPLCGPLGTGEAEVTPEHVRFNGAERCGHAKRDLGITWPSSTASGVAFPANAGGKWFGGDLLSARTCGGDCSHETFVFDRLFDQPRWLTSAFNGCKTAYKPYDLDVTAFLVIAKHHLGPALTVHSDGELRDWQDAMRACQHVLQYGEDFQLDREEETAQKSTWVADDFIGGRP